MVIRVLILCIENTCRSQIGEGFLKSLAGNRIEVHSAGLRKGFGVNPFAIEVMKEMGVNISSQSSKSVQDFLKQDFDFVITTCHQAREACPYFPGKTKMIHWDIEDPAGVVGSREEKLDAFRVARDKILEKVRLFLKENLA
ncbi:MAG: arsenate reductase ArsC [Candidatus Helarchaeota archaeon]